MLNCREVAERAEDWLDKDMGTWRSFQMRMHLAVCKGCSRFMSQMRLTRGLTDVATDLESNNLRDGDDRQIDAILSRLHDEKNSKG